MNREANPNEEARPGSRSDEGAARERSGLELDWNEVLGAMDLAHLGLQIEGRMGDRLRRSYQSEDVLQDVLLLAWRARDTVEWRGPSAFRNWLLTIAERRILDLAKHEQAFKRGGELTCLRFSELDEDSDPLRAIDRASDEPTPFAHARRIDDLVHMREILAELPAMYRDVLYLRLFEERTVVEVARRLGLGISAVKHRSRTGGLVYLRKLGVIPETSEGLAA